MSKDNPQSSPHTKDWPFLVGYAPMAVPRWPHSCFQSVAACFPPQSGQCCISSLCSAAPPPGMHWKGGKSPPPPPGGPCARDHVQHLCSRLSPAWNYGEWAAGFYSQLCIRVVSADGLTPGYTPEEGYSQGNPFLANGYQGASVLASSSLPFPKHIRIPPWPSPTALPINRVYYSDDRAFFEPTIARVSVIAGECVRATLHTNGVPNMDKLEFSYHTLDAGGLPQPAIVEVPRFKTRTLPAPPLIVGIPIFSDLLRTFRSVYHSTRDKPMSPLLMVRSFVAFALSRWDFVFSGVLAPPDWHHDLQVYAHKAYRAAFTLPPWTCNAFLHLPLHAGGVGCPSLPLRNLSLLAMTYLHASVSRNPLSRVSAVYLLDTVAPFSEGMALRTPGHPAHARPHPPFPPPA